MNIILPLKDRYLGLPGVFPDFLRIAIFPALKTHTPQIWEVEIHPGGEIFTPQICGVWVLRVGEDEEKQGKNLRS